MARDLFKKMEKPRYIFHAKMGTIKDRKGVHLTETADTKKRWHEYTEELFRKILMTQITTMM